MFSLVVVKWRAERRAAAIKSSALAGAALARGADSPSSRPGEPGLAASSPLVGRVATESARMLHQDSARTHRARGHAPTSPHERWRVKLPGPIVSQPTLAPDERTVYVTSLDGKLSALGRDQGGAIKWTVDLGARAYATPLVTDDGMVFVGSDAKKFFAITPAGVIAWKLDVDGEADTGAVLFGSDRIAFAAGSTLHVVTTRGEAKARFRARKKIFTSPVVVGLAPPAAFADASAASTPNANANANPPPRDAVIYFGSQDRRAYAVRSDGTLVWSTDLGAEVDGGPALADDGSIIFGTDGGRVVKLESARGTTVWSAEVGGYVRGAVSISRDGSILTGTYGPTPGVLRLSPDEGRLLGAFRIAGTGSRDFGVHGGPLEDDDGTLVFGAEDDRLYAIERSGRIRFALARGADIDAPVTLTKDGALIVGADDGTVAELGD